MIMKKLKTRSTKMCEEYSASATSFAEETHKNSSLASLPNTEQDWDLLKAECQAFDAMALLGDEPCSRLQKHKEKRDSMGLDIRLPNFFWIACKGGGVSTCAKALAEFMYYARLFEFVGINRCFEFKLGYVAPNTSFSELIRFQNSMADVAGYHRFFRGVACIDINDWERRTDEAHFSKFLEYVNMINDKILAVFYVNNTDRNIIERIETSLSAHIRFETIRLKFPDTVDLVEHIETRFLKPQMQNFQLETDAKELLKDTIDVIKKSKNFNGFSTIKNLATDILSDISTSDIVCKKISAKSLTRLNTLYVERFRDKGTGLGFNK